MRKTTVAQHKKAGNDIYNTGIYRRGRNHSPIEGSPSHHDIYYLSEDGEIIMLAYNTSYHRTLVLIRALRDGTIYDIPEVIIDNYSTNGYNTRCGMKRAIKNLDRIILIANSHVDYMSNETGNSLIDHNARVMLRN